MSSAAMAQIPFNTSTISGQLIPSSIGADHYDSIVNTGCDAVNDVRVAVCDGSRPQLFWQVGTRTGFTALHHQNAKSTDVALMYDQTSRYWAVVAYYLQDSVGVFLEGYELNTTTNDFDFITSTSSYPNPLNAGNTTGFYCKGTVNIDADQNLHFVVVFDEGNSISLTHSLAIGGEINTSAGCVISVSTTGVKLANPSNNGDLENYQPDVSMAYDYNNGDPITYTYFTFITRDSLGDTRVNVELNDEFPYFGSLDDAGSSHNIFWSGRPEHDYLAHPAISSHPDYGTHRKTWVVAVEDVSSTLSDINMYTPGTAPGVYLDVPTAGLLSDLHLSLYENTRPDVCYDYQLDAVNVCWNFYNTDYAPLFYEPISVRYVFSFSPGYVIQGTTSSQTNIYTEVTDYTTCVSCKHSQSVSIGGRFASPISGFYSAKIYSYYDNVNNEWYFKTPDDGALRIRQPEQVAAGALILDEALEQQLLAKMPAGLASFSLYQADGQFIMNGNASAMQLAHQLTAQKGNWAKGIYLLHFNSIEGSSSIKLLNF